MRKIKSILVIDDDPDMRSYLRKMIEAMGHEFYESGDLEDAAKKLEKVVPHLILLDINLENENGFTFITKLREFDHYRRIKLIMISSLSSKKAIDLSHKIGASGYLIKPINNNVIHSTIKKILPELEFPDAQNIGEPASLLMANCLAQITKVSETSMVIRSKVKFSEKTKINISSTFLRKIELNRAQLVIHTKSKDVSPGIYDTEVSFVGLKESDLKGIRSLNTKKV